MELGKPKIPGRDSMHFNLPTDVTVADDGSFYVSDGYGNSRIVKFSKEGKYLFEWGEKGDKPGEFNIPHMIDIDAKGNVYVADRENSRIQKFSADGSFLKEWRSTEAVQLYSLTVDKKTNGLFAVDLLTVNDSIIKGSDIIQFDSTMTVMTRFGRSESNNWPMFDLHDIAVDNDESIYVCGTETLKLLKFKKIVTK